MVNKPLAAFIKDNLSKGYTIFAVRQHLLEQGYLDKDINEAIDYIYNPVQKHEIHLSKAVIAIVLILMITMAITAYFVFRPQAEQPGQLLDISMTARSERSLKPGSQFSFQYELTNTGAQKRYDVLMTFELAERATGNVLDTFEKTIAVQTSTSQIETITIPKDAPLGQYFVRAIASYKKEEAKSSLSINVIQDSITPTCTDGIKNQNEENVDCGGPCKLCESCTDGIKDQNEEEIDCGGVCSPCSAATTTTLSSGDIITTPEKPSWEIIKDIKTLAASSPEEALSECIKQRQDIKDTCLGDISGITGNREYCNDIKDSSKKDSCISDSAIKNNDKEYCKDITTDYMRDQCYMNFILNTENPQFPCEDLTNPSLKRACESLRMSRTTS